MLIDWFTVGAQVLNFLVLVWLMKRFLYRPILNAIDAREKRIAAELADAAAKQIQAQQQFDEFQEKNRAFEQQRAELFSQASHDAETERQRLIAEARQAADTLSQQRMAALQNDADNLKQAIRRRTQQEVFAIARKVLADLACTDLEEQMGKILVKRLQALNDDDKTQFAKALAATSGAVLVRSAFTLPEPQQTAIRQSLAELFPTPIALEFSIAQDLVGGIELSANGQKIAWSINDYLSALEKALDFMIQTPEVSETPNNP